MLIFFLLFQAQQPRKSPIYHTASDPEVKDDLDDFEPELEAIYEPPPTSRIKKQSLTTPSESDDPQYSGQSIYGRAPSQCSSISATQRYVLIRFCLDIQYIFCLFY